MLSDYQAGRGQERMIRRRLIVASDGHAKNFSIFITPAAATI
ncbi:hypothetical protein [Bradyrhizobium murdochi]|nr:hypothetical protein [Bradyrhizobium murdochi]